MVDRRWRLWTDDELQRAIKMRRNGATYDEIGEQIHGVMGETARRRLLPYFGAGEVVIERHARLKDVIAERDVRLEAIARKSITQSMFGDPPPGYSALHGKVGMT